MLMSPPNCWRKRTDCIPMHAVEALPPIETDEDWERLEAGDIEPFSFVCGGCVRVDSRAVPQDAYRVCWKNDVVDDMGEYDEQDIAHQMAVLSQMLAIIAARRTRRDHIEVPDDEDGLILAAVNHG
ncbi:hypothetical protein KIKIMORA_00480 [Brevundimonas phage vB_BpoS-Kikimora]|uniref:Uncharacterized protein n=1 Tax=Brevundimonas phage vB_BpoS-Kikimora TaxID=2948601 RepID=A0A9E7MRH1_9CAUD|nr:hypothetical protein KIKIMORA_00480 [Brevundimonas phage vB_BpoS-Kikimora]